MKTHLLFRFPIKLLRKDYLKFLALAANFFVIASFLFLIGFVIKESVVGFQHYGFNRIFLTSDFNFQNTNKSVSFWLPLAVTLFISVFALLIAAPLGIKTALFIHFRIKNPSFKKTLCFFIDILTGVPSVIFGIFARDYLGEFFKVIFNLPNSYNLITGFFMLAFMILPTIIALVTQALDTVDPDLYKNSISLGVSKTKTIYRIILRKIAPYIFVALLIALGRGIGETMAVSMLLQAENYNNVFNSGFYDFLTSSLTPLGAVISTNMFSDGVGPETRSVLFAFGLALMVIVTLLNGIIYFFVRQISKQRVQKHTGGWNVRATHYFRSCQNFRQQLKWEFEKKVYPPAKQFAIKTDWSLGNYVLERKFKHRLAWSNDAFKLGGEWLSAITVTLFIGWISFVILIQGLISWSGPYSTLFVYGKNTTGLAFANTVLIIVVAVVIALPASLLVAIYLNEYCKSRWFKGLVGFFLDILGATPSIIFALFGLSFFILTLGLSASGIQGRSLLAGALTIAFVILPNYIKMLLAQLQSVSQEQRNNSYALGVSKMQTIFRIVLPQALSGIIRSTIVTTGRIMGETAPLFLTAGLSSGVSYALNSPGQTLTTRIFAQLINTNIASAQAIMYESALLSIILMMLVIFLCNILLPWISENKKYTMIFLFYYQISRLLVLYYKLQIKWWLIAYGYCYKPNIQAKYLVRIQHLKRLQSIQLQAWSK